MAISADEVCIDWIELTSDVPAEPIGCRVLVGDKWAWMPAREFKAWFGFGLDDVLASFGKSA